MKHLFSLLPLALLLAACATRPLPPFATASQWTLSGNVARSARCDMAVDLGGGSTFPITNASNGDYDLHFVLTTPQLEAGDAFCRDYIASAICQIPLAIDSIEFVLAERYILLSHNPLSRWMPHLVRQADGTELVVEANPCATAVQPHDEIWRNFIFDDKRHRILVVDRIVKNGRHLALVYILQAETPRVPFTSTFHYDVTSRLNTQPVGEYMRALMDITIAALASRAR